MQPTPALCCLMTCLISGPVLAQSVNLPPVNQFPQTWMPKYVMPAMQAPVVPDVPPGPLPTRTDASGLRKLASHTWILPGDPNTVIVVGKTAALIVDTGLGTEAGRAVAKAAKSIAPGRTLYLTTTEFLPERASGVGGFPPGTKLLRPGIQQKELDLDHGLTLSQYRINNAQALTGADYGTPELFHGSRILDLGEVHARLVWPGPAHTYGNEAVFVPEDGVLASGDVVGNKLAPAFLSPGICAADWRRALSRLAALQPRLVVPAQGQPGAGRPLLAAESDFLWHISSFVRQTKTDVRNKSTATGIIYQALKMKYPDWTIGPLTAVGIQCEL